MIIFVAIIILLLFCQTIIESPVNRLLYNLKEQIKKLTYSLFNDISSIRQYFQTKTSDKYLVSESLSYCDSILDTVKRHEEDVIKYYISHVASNIEKLEKEESVVCKQTDINTLTNQQSQQTIVNTVTTNSTIKSINKGNYDHLEIINIMKQFVILLRSNVFELKGEIVKGVFDKGDQQQLMDRLTEYAKYVINKQYKLMIGNQKDKSHTCLSCQYGVNTELETRAWLCQHLTITRKKINEVNRNNGTNDDGIKYLLTLEDSLIQGFNDNDEIISLGEPTTEVYCVVDIIVDEHKKSLNRKVNDPHFNQRKTVDKHSKPSKTTKRIDDDLDDWILQVEKILISSLCIDCY